jgi:hypothetical protein
MIWHTRVSLSEFAFIVLADWQGTKLTAGAWMDSPAALETESPFAILAN